jgi:hypothetical protein
MSETNREAQGCDALKKLYDDGDIIFEELAHATHGSSKKSTLYLVKIASSVGKDPCSYVKAQNSDCRLIVKNAPDPEVGKNWDYYLMHCHYGPPCTFLENIDRE